MKTAKAFERKGLDRWDCSAPLAPAARYNCAACCFRKIEIRIRRLRVRVVETLLENQVLAVPQGEGETELWLVFGEPGPARLLDRSA